MGKRGFWRVFVGGGLILMGIASILQSYQIIRGEIWSVIFAILFALAGLGFLVNWFQDREHWWALIPGFMLFGIALTIGFSEFTSGLLNNLAGAIFMLFAGLSFLVVYLTKRTFWWALIPGFIMTGLSVMIGLEETKVLDSDFAAAIFLGSIAISFLVVFLIRRDFWWAIIPAGAMAGVSLLVAFNSVAVLFLALALTFGIIGLMRLGTERMTWAWIPGGVMFVLAVMFYWFDTGATLIGTLLLPGVLILVGIYLLLRVFLKRS